MINLQIKHNDIFLLMKRQSLMLLSLEADPIIMIFFNSTLEKIEKLKRAIF